MKKSLLLSVCLLAIIFIYSPWLTAQEAINFNFADSNLENFIEYVAKMTNKKILYDSTIKGRKIFLISRTAISPQDLYKIFLSVMEYNGYILETTGTGNSEVIKVKRNIQGPWTQTRTIYTEKELETLKEEDQFITMVIKLNYISSREVQTTLRALRIVNPQGGNLAGIEGSNTILITDFAPNVKRIYDVIKLMDQQGPEHQFQLIKLKHAVAEEVAEKLTEFVNKEKAASGVGMGPDLEQIKISADRRLNAIIVQAYQEKMKKMVALIEELDQDLTDEPSTIHYIRLKHADAKKLQETLGKILESGGLSKKALGSTGKVASTTTSPATEVSTSIQAEPQTNSLIVRAETYEWKEIEAIIKQVDVRRPQVLIEGALIEISPEDVFGLGIELFWAESPRDGVTFGAGSDFGFSNLATVNEDGSAKVLDSKTTSFGNDIEKIGKVPIGNRSDFSRGITSFLNYKDIFTMPALLKAIKTDGDFKILSIPSILTNDHEKAQIKVADAAPAATSTENNSGSRTDTFSGFQEAGTTLTITPHISGETNYLRLDVEQSIDEFDRSQGSVSGVPPKRLRKITTSITVPDGQTVAIGGFTFDSESETIDKIPLVGDLPIIGILFQTKIVTHRKRNIYLFITPHILRENSFSDLFKHSFDYKMKAHKLGADVGAIDQSFEKYLKRYGHKKGGMAPAYMIEYKTPENLNETK